MKICYVVYREDNVMVFDSQVLEYLENLDQKVDFVELIVFRHEKNLFKKNNIETKIRQYVKSCKTFSSLPVLIRAQLNINALRLKRYVHKKYALSEQIAVICRGDLATYVAAKGFKEMENVRILYDNRGLPLEESEMSHGSQIIYKLNRRVKAYAINYAKDHCDMYNFVTNRLRDYNIQKYGYDVKIPYTIIPTLYSYEPVSTESIEIIRKKERCNSNDFIVSYVGSTAAWQSTDKLLKIIKKIFDYCKNVKFFILTNGTLPMIKELPPELIERITIKSVPHSDMKYYLAMTDIGIVIRDNNIVNQVAAPTKIAEYLLNGVKILYSGDIGVFNDLKQFVDQNRIICLDHPCWIEKLCKKENRNVNLNIIDYFNIDKRQEDTLLMIRKAFQEEKSQYNSK